MQSHDNTAKAHIGAESSSNRSSIATRKRALQLAKALRRSEITHFRWSPAFGCLVHQCRCAHRQARGGIPGSDPNRGDDLCSRLHARATDFHFTNRGTGIVFLISTSPPQGNTEADWGHWGQTRFGHARAQRMQTAPIYSAQFRPSVKKRPQLRWELRD
jgi:hypothetical protein